MNQRQINSLNMFNAVLQFLDEKNVEWNANPLIAAGVQSFKNPVGLIQQEAAAQQSKNPKGYTNKKDQDLETLIDLCYKLALRVKNYAVSIKDAVLTQQTSFSRSQIEAGKEKEIVNRCLVIISKANSVTVTAPAAFKITQELIAQTAAVAAAIDPDRAERDVVRGARSSTTMQLNKLFTTARKQLQTLDDLIEGDADDNNSTFVRDYFIMRRTVDRVSGARKPAPATGSDESAAPAPAA